jgi:Polyketide cyclase / dehydrase and lipid transport
MAAAINSVRIAGPAGPVFDLITSARFWPEWHPASQAVGGVTQRPYQLGEVIHERAQFAGRDFQVMWTVVEHVRPSRVVLQSGHSPSRIIYSFTEHNGIVELRRELVYDETTFRAVLPELENLEGVMQTQSEEGLMRLKDLVEGLLRAEAFPPGKS